MPVILIHVTCDLVSHPVYIFAMARYICGHTVTSMLYGMTHIHSMRY